MDKYQSFWDERAIGKKDFKHSLSNLTEDEIAAERKSKQENYVIKEAFKSINRNFNSAIDIGAGTCQWSEVLTSYAKEVLATDTSEKMLNHGRELLKNSNQGKKVKYYEGDITEEVEKESPGSPYDLIFISGLILYLNDSKLENLLNFIKRNSSKDSITILREPVALNERYILDDIYSKELKTKYSAIYRTQDNLIESFRKISFTLESTQWFHYNGSEFNKWKETRLKLFTFKRV
tara:strand:- start:8961 stop:9665 length:705 start_codon:yes stop_codon:yes gene_type:complete